MHQDFVAASVDPAAGLEITCQAYVPEAVVHQVESGQLLRGCQRARKAPLHQQQCLDYI